MVNNSTTLAILGLLFFLRGTSPTTTTDDDNSRELQAEAASLECECGLTGGTRHGKEVSGDGDLAPPHAWPWVASIVNVSVADDPVAYCGASLINDRYVMTASHCIPDMNETGIENFRVFLGTNYVDRRGEWKVEYKIDKVKVHPGFDFETADKDIALLRLDGKVVFRRWVRPVCLRQGDGEFVGKLGVILGWGAHNLSLPTDDDLQESSVRVVSNAECARNYSAEDIPITPNMICAQLDGAHPCKGDSGGPLVVRVGASSRYTQIGIISHGEGCGVMGYPGIFSRVGTLLGWVRANTLDASFCRGSFDFN